MLVGLIFFGTQLPISKILHISEICSQISFDDDQCILIKDGAVLKILQNLVLQFVIIWRIHEYAVENALPLQGTKGLQHIHVQQFTTICKFCKCKIFFYAGTCLGIFLNKNSLSSSAAECFNADGSASAEQIKKTTVQKFRLKNIKKSFFDAVRGGACFHARHGFKV